MVENFKISLRHLWNNKLFSFINILGLALGLSACFILIMHIRFETGYDRTHVNRDRIVRVLHNDYSYTPMVMSGVLPEYFPEIDKIVRIGKFDWTRFYIIQGQNFVEEKNLLYSDSTFFEVFSFPIETGNRTNVLRSPDRIMISESMAGKYFGKENPMGMTLSFRIMNATHTFTVEGVFRDFPEQSHFHANFIMSMKFYQSVMGPQMLTNWGANSILTYLLLKQPGMMQEMSARMPGFIKKYVPEDGFGGDRKYTLQSLARIHLYSNKIEADIEPQGSITRVVIFASIAILVLVVAVVNFVLLSLAISYQRIKEFGIRKIAGARRKEMISLVSTEFLIIFILASLIALMVEELAIRFLESHMGFRVAGNAFSNAVLLLSFMTMAFLLGYVASTYITLQVLRIRPVDALKSRFPISKGGVTSRGVLVVFQFSIMIVLMVSLLVIHKQLRMIRNRDLGYRKEQLISLNIPFETGKQYTLLSEELRKLSGVQHVAGANYMPPTGQWWITYMMNPENREKLEVEEIRGDYDLAETLGLEITQGRSFSREYGDSLSMLISESGLKMSGLANPLESYLVLGEKDTVVSRIHIVGVFKDFNMRSLYDEIRPMAIFLNTSVIQQMAIRVESTDTRALIREIEKVWARIYPDDPIQYYFVDEALHQTYLKEDQSQTIIGVFALLSLFIALMGLFGLSSYTLERRTKEIGIRLVNGAGIRDVFYALSKQFVLWILVSFVVAAPLSYYAMNRWLQHFAYRTPISWWVFILSLLVSLLVAAITISWQTYRAATRNPVEALRYE
jgi:putative ABC transport system permease protein